MNNKKNRKGFTIVELVIVIAVIAILATVLVPTFGDIITKANKSAALQEARNLYTEFVAEHDYKTGSPSEDLIIKVDNYYVVVSDSQMVDNVQTDYAAAQDLIDPPAGYSYTWEDAEEGVNVPTSTKNS